MMLDEAHKISRNIQVIESLASMDDTFFSFSLVTYCSLEDFTKLKTFSHMSLTSAAHADRMTGRSMGLPRILMVSDVYFPRVNGVSTSIQTFRDDLAALGCASLLIAPEYPEAREDEPGITRVRSRYLPFDPEDRIMVRRELDRACASLAAQIDLIHIQTPFLAHYAALRLARALGLKTVETYHTYFEHYMHHYLPLVPRAVSSALARQLSRAQCNAVDTVISPSPQMAEALRGYGVESRIEVIPTGVDLRKFAGGDGVRFRAALGIDAQRPVMLTVGRVAFEKNLEFLIDVLASVRLEVPDVLLLIAGEGPARGALEQRVAKLGLERSVRFVGYLDRASGLLDCYSSADLFVFASRTETQGLVLLEAMALGVPVVSTAVMGTRDVLDGARGAIVVDEDKASFARAATQVLTDRSLRHSLAAEASQFVASRWSSAAMARRMLECYRRVLADTRAL
jgi:1,2-diacylglycerol 3-alpha-glucosyltransferase